MNRFKSLLVLILSVLLLSCNMPGNNSDDDVSSDFYKNITINKNIITIEWKPVAGAKSYKFYSALTDDTSVSVKDMVSYITPDIISETSFTITCVNSGNLFYYVEAYGEHDILLARADKVEYKKYDASFDWVKTSCKKNESEATLDLYWSDKNGANLYRLYYLETEKSSGVTFDEIIAAKSFLDIEESYAHLIDFSFDKNYWFAIVSYYVDSDGTEYEMYQNKNVYGPVLFKNPAEFDLQEIYQEKDRVYLYWDKCSLADHYVVYYGNNSDKRSGFDKNYDNGNYESYSLKSCGASFLVQETGTVYYYMVVAYDKDDKKLSEIKYGVVQCYVAKGYVAPSENVEKFSFNSISPVGNRISLSWDKISRAEKYVVYCYVDLYSGNYTPSEIMQKASEMKNATSNKYFWEVKASDRGYYGHFAVAAYSATGRLIGISSSQQVIFFQRN